MSVRMIDLAADIGLRFWGSDCVLDGGCDGNTTVGSMACDNCGSERFTVPLFVEMAK